MIVEEGCEDCDHEGQIGEDMLSPRLGNVKGDHSDHVDVVNKQKEYVSLKAVSKTSVSVIVDLCVVHPSVCPVVVAVVCLENGNYRNLASYLDTKSDDHLSQIGQSE